MPDTVETFPCDLKNGGIIQISIKFTACILPVSRAENRTEKAAFSPVSKKSASAERAPVKKNIPAHIMGFVNFFIYSFAAACAQIILNNGRTTPVKIDVVLLML